MDRRRKASGISGGIFLIGLGVLIITGWWWPGIMLVIGLSGGAEQIFRGRIASGIGTIAFFTAIPVIWALVESTNLTWAIVGPFILIALGAIILVRVFYLKDEDESEEVVDIGEPTD
jgi:hypothetical protein